LWNLKLVDLSLPYPDPSLDATLEEYSVAVADWKYREVRLDSHDSDITYQLLQPMDFQEELALHTSIFIASVVNMTNADGIPIGFYPLPPALIPTPPLKIDGSNNTLAFSAHNVTQITALNCTLGVYEADMEVDIETKALTSPTSYLSNATSPHPFMMSPGTDGLTDFLMVAVGVSQIHILQSDTNEVIS
jgi:hypothetical protein